MFSTTLSDGNYHLDIVNCSTRIVKRDRSAKNG